ncbi:MAG: DUF3021 family protein [bacterium]|nr:DUF3021 family protein [bacterium]
MNAILKKYLPGLSMGFSIVVLAGCGMKLVTGDELNGFALFIIELAGYLVMAALVDALVARINFKSYLSNFICETAILYPITLITAWIGSWFGMRLKNIVFFSIMFIVIMAVIHIYFYYMMKQEAEQINEYLRVRKKE